MSTFIMLEDTRRVQVVETACRWLACLQPGYHTIRSAAGASGCSARTDLQLVCVRWTDRGCPPPDQRRRVTFAELHPDGPGRWPYRVRTANRRLMTCLCCLGRFPAWMVADAQQRKDDR